MKKIRQIAAVLTIAAVAAVLFGCGKNNTPATSEPYSSSAPTTTVGMGGENTGKAELAMITYQNAVYEDTFNKQINDAIKDYADTNNLKFKSYDADDKTTNSYLDTIRKAVDSGARLVVMNGQEFENAVFHAQELYSDVNFVLIDGKPNNGDTTPVYRTNSNVVSAIFADEELGYLCGYAAVKDGYKKLGCIGYADTFCARNYAYGFAQGAEAAAKELNMTGLALKSAYLKSEGDKTEAKDTAEQWYKNGTEVIAVFGGDLCKDVAGAAEGNKGKVICTDAGDNKSDALLVSAERGGTAAIAKLAAQYYDGTFPGGQTVTFNAANEGIKLNMQNAGFAKFNEDAYKKLYEKLASGKTTIKNADNIKTLDDLKLTAVKTEEKA